MQLPRLYRFLRATRANPLNPYPHRLILGNVASGWSPGRDPASKYFVSTAQFDGAKFPSFVTGPSYVVSAPAVSELLAGALERPYVSLEDVFLTGIVAEAAGVPRRLVMEFRNNAERIPTKFLGCTLLRTISIHKVKPEEHAELTEAARRPECGNPGNPPHPRKRKKPVKRVKAETP